MKTFNEVVNKHKDNLELYVPVVGRVHGPSHPEFYAVKKEYDAMVEKVNSDKLIELKDNFENLRKITNDYTVPSDTCETYEAVYTMLQELDQAYTE
ncbi:MAG: iron-sulfur cluster repair di-iron protein, ric [Erysipelothrix sp.]|nr:iron-sulfur cluster repair di-iron protein, ric [Erysipelothrix sp.]